VSFTAGVDIWKIWGCPDGLGPFCETRAMVERTCNGARNTPTCKYCTGPVLFVRVPGDRIPSIEKPIRE